jgi:hypothetical protein
MRRVLRLAIVALTCVGCAGAPTPRVESAVADTEATTNGTEPERRSEEPTQSVVLAGSRSDPRRPENPEPEPESVSESVTERSPSTVVAPSSPLLLARMEQLQRDIQELEQLVAMVVDLRGRLIPAGATVPSACVDRTELEALRMTAVSGSTRSASAGTLLTAIERWCERFQRWTQPEGVVMMRIVDYHGLITRIEGWMRDIQRCEGATGAEAARCLNAYDQTTRETSEEATRILALMAEHRREIAGSDSGRVRFPCESAVLARIEATTRWTGTVARAQMRSLPRAHRGVCELIGVGGATRRDAEDELGRSLDQTESQARSLRRQLMEQLEILRATGG